MMNKQFSICIAGLLLISAAAACIQAAVPPVSRQAEITDTAVRFGRVKYIDGDNSFLIEYGDMNAPHDGSAPMNPAWSSSAFLTCGRQETVTLPDTVAVTVSVGGKESTAAAYQISVGSLLKLQYNGPSLLSVTILNDEAAAFAGQIKAAFLSGDIDKLDKLMSYPCYVTLSPEGSGRIVKNRKELSALSGQLFTPSFLSTFKAFDPLSIDPVQANVIIGREGGAPAVTFHIDSDGTPGITGISAVN